MQKHTRWSRVLFLILFSLEIVASALIAMYIASLLAKPFSAINSILILFVGIIGFAYGTLFFWGVSEKFSR